MKCPKCEFENSANAKFCIECGHALRTPSGTPRPDLSYDEKLKKIQKYLPKGLAEKILSQRDKIEGERKHITVMFCDMVEFTRISEKMGAEEAYSILDQIYEILIHKVHDYEGTINEMPGDGIVALFGAPITLEDAPQRALWSALSIHKEIARFSQKNPDIGPIKMRIGIHTGAVVVGSLGNDLRVEFKAVGDTVNLAARMEQLAKPETTYVTEETFKRTNGLFQFEAIGKRAVKGKGKTIPVYKVLSSKEDLHRPRLGSERMIYSEMVAREKELNRLELQVLKAINGEGSVVNIIGEAGIGKTRIIAELKKRDVIKRVAVLEGSAVSIGKNLNFHPIIDLLKQWARIKTNDGEKIAYGKVEAAVKHLCPEKAGKMIPFIAILMGMKLSGKYAEKFERIEGEALENLILKTIRELLIRAAEMTPLVIIMEDLHWADTSTIELLKSLTRLAETQRILFINAFRPSYKKTGDRLVESVKKSAGSYYIEIELEPLDEEMSEILITNILGLSELQQTISEPIISKAGGNPFFMEEVVRSLIDEGAVEVKDGIFQVTEKIHAIAIPKTINDVLMARIDRLDEETRNLVKIASVIGRNFFCRVLIDVAGMVEDIKGKLLYLKEVQILQEHKRLDEVEYLFKHALMQEVAYESILPLKRKELHLKVAGSIENIFKERLHEFYGMLAYHCSMAENQEKAEKYLIKAGQEALRSSASNEALHFYREALILYQKTSGNEGDSAKIATLEKNIALALYNRGQYDEAVKYFDKALTYYWGKFPKSAIPRAFKFLAAFLHFMIALFFPSLKFRKDLNQREAEGVDLSYKKCKALTIINPKRFFLEALYVVCRISKFDINKFDLGTQMFVGASALFSFTGLSFSLSRKVLDSVKDRVSKQDTRSYSTFILLKTIHNYLEGKWVAIRPYDDELIKRNLSLGEIWDASQHLYWHGYLNIYQGSMDVARRIVDRLVKIFNDYENEISISFKFELNAHLLTERRKFHEALNEISSGIHFAPKIGLSYFLIEMYSCQALIHILMEDPHRAEIALKRAHNIRKKIDATVPFQLSNIYRSQLAYDIYQLKKSINSRNRHQYSEYRAKAYRSSNKLINISHKAAQHRIDAYTLRGIYYWLLKKQGKAFKWWRKAIEEGQRLNARLQLSRTYFEIGRHLRTAEGKYKVLDAQGADAFLAKSKMMFDEMNLQWDQDMLRQVESQ